MYFAALMKSSHQVCSDILDLKILFSSRINMNIFFIFVKTSDKNYMFKVGLNRFMGIQAKLTVYFIKFK
jgi:hypothetical protein